MSLDKSYGKIDPVPLYKHSQEAQQEASDGEFSPIPEKVPVVGSWFEKQELKINRLSPDQLAWLYAQGWSGSIDKGVSFDPYGYAYGYLERTEIKANKVLQDLVRDYVEAYNQGRSINDARYDDIIRIWTAVLNQSQDEWGTLQGDDVDYDVLVEGLIDGISTDHSDYDGDTAKSLDNWGGSERTRIADQFDSQVSKAQSDLISRGLNNTTVWSTVNAGVERERSIANTDLEDQITQRQLDLKHRLYDTKSQMRARILAARDRLRAPIHGERNTRLAQRNTIIEALTRFMERRTDSYPTLSEVGNLAAALGSGSPNSFVAGR